MSHQNVTSDKLSSGADEKLIADDGSGSENFTDEHVPNETKAAERDQNTKMSSEDSSRSILSKSRGTKSGMKHTKEDDRIPDVLDKDGANKSVRENQFQSSKKNSGSSHHQHVSINTDDDRESPLIVNQEEDGMKQKFRHEKKQTDIKCSTGDSNNQEDRQAKTRHVISNESSSRAHGLNGSSNSTSAKGSHTKSKSTVGNITAKTDFCDDPKILEHMSDSKDCVGSAESCNSEGGNRRPRKASRRVTSESSVPIEPNSADQYDSNIKTTKRFRSQVMVYDKTKSSSNSKVDAKYTKLIKEHDERGDELSVPENSCLKYNNGGARSKNEPCKSSVINRGGISIQIPSASSNSGTEDPRRHFDEKTSELRNSSGSSSNGDGSRDGDSNSDGDRSRSSRSSRSRRWSEGNSSSGSNRSCNSRSSSSGSDSSKSDNCRRNESRNNSSRSNSTRSSSFSSSSQNGNRSSREGSSNSLNRLAETGAIPRKRDDLTEEHSGSSKNQRSATGNTTSMARRSSESNSSSSLISDNKYRNSRGSKDGVQEEKRERSRQSVTKEISSSSGTLTDSSNSEDDGCNTRKKEPKHVNKSGKAGKEFGASYHLNNSKSIQHNVHIEFEWQYRDDQGGWVTYGQSGGNAPGSKMVTSDDIEKYYTEDPDRTPLLIEFNNNKYILDFQKLKQTSQRTSHQRDIRRILKLPRNKNSSQNRGDPSNSGAASGRSNTSGRYGVENPPNAGDGRVDRGMYYDNNTLSNTNAGRVLAGNSAQNTDDPSVAYAWQIKDKHGKWIAYGNANTYFDKSNATTSSSEDIEKAYSNKHNMPYFEIESQNHSYLLDFERMVQINNQTQVKRPIRRVVKESPKKGLVAKSFKKLFGKFNGPKIPKEEFTTPHKWQFMDEHGVWISYGQSNSAGNVICTTNTTSDDIEEYVSTGAPKQRMTINSTHNTYNLDFSNMTQTNTRTLIQRPIRRVLKNNRDDFGRNYNRNTTEVSMNADQGYNSAYVPPGRPTNRSASTHLWQFEDELGRWITYGESCSTVMGSGTTNATTDDIEEYYLNSNGEMPMFVKNIYNEYILDFQTMCQTNQSTSVQRRIRRIAKQSEMTRNHWR